MRGNLLGLLFLAKDVTVPARLTFCLVLNLKFQVGAKDHLRFQASYATILKAHMTALKKRGRKQKKKTNDTN